MQGYQTQRSFLEIASRDCRLVTIMDLVQTRANRLLDADHDAPHGLRGGFQTANLITSCINLSAGSCSQAANVAIIMPITPVATTFDCLHAVPENELETL